MFCENCGHFIKHPWPVEPVFTLDVAATILNMRLSTLHSWLHRAKYEPTYQKIKAEGQRQASRHRILKASEIKAISEAITYKASRYRDREGKQGKG